MNKIGVENSVNAALVAENRLKAAVRAALMKHGGRAGVPFVEIAADTGIDVEKLYAMREGRRSVQFGEFVLLCQRMPVAFAQDVFVTLGLAVDRLAAPTDVNLHDTQEHLLELGAEIARTQKRGRLCHRTLAALKAKARPVMSRLFGLMRREARQEQAA